MQSILEMSNGQRQIFAAISFAKIAALVGKLTLSGSPLRSELSKSSLNIFQKGG
jgi:hypothetical protein